MRGRFGLRWGLAPALLVVAATVLVPAPADAAATVAQDSFSTDAASGFGVASTGGAWSISGGTSRYSVSGGAGHVSTSPGVTTAAYLNGVSARDLDAVATISVSELPAGGSDYEKLLVRRSGSTDDSGLLLIGASGAVTVGLLVGGTTVQTAKPAGLTVTAGTALRIRVQAVGASPTQLRARAWRADAPEPSTWQVTASDSSGPQTGGGVGIRSYRTSSTTTGARTDLDDLSVVDASAANAPPTSAFTSTPSGLTVAVNGSASTDQEGPIAAYSWGFGDGGVASGVTASHTYGVAGTYVVTLTVTDTAGASSSSSRSVAVTGRPTQAQWLADVSTAVAGATDLLDARAGAAPRQAIVLDIDNTAIQSYYQSRTATPPILTIAQRAIADGYTVLVATGRSADAGYTAAELANAGYAVTSLCFKDPTATSTQASKTACRASWVAQGYTIVANFGNHTTDLNGGNSGTAYLLPNYGFLD